MSWPAAPKRSVSRARIAPCTSAIWSVVGTRPVPMAQTGSYATTSVAPDAASGIEAASCPLDHGEGHVGVALRLGFSPTQMMAAEPGGQRRLGLGAQPSRSTSS